MDEIKTYKVSQVGKMLNVSAQTLRGYCNKGLVSGCQYALGRRRTFTAEQVDWLKQAALLSRAGFSTKDLRKYVQLCQKTDQESKVERLAMLRTHKRQAWQDLLDLQETIDFVERQEELLSDGEA